MAFNINFPYGQCIGGALDGCVEQDGKWYRRDGTEVNQQNEPVKEPATKGSKKGADATKKEADKEPATPEELQLAAQLSS